MEMRFRSRGGYCNDRSLLRIANSPTDDAGVGKEAMRTLLATIATTLLGSANALAAAGFSRRAVLLVPSVTTFSAPAFAEAGNVGTAAERIARSGQNAEINSGDRRCSSGVFLNFKPGTCSPLGDLYDAAAMEAPQKEQDTMDDLAASFMQRSSVEQPAEEAAKPRAAAVSMMAKQDEPEEWKPPAVFSAQNAGPWAILVLVGTFHGVASRRPRAACGGRVRGCWLRKVPGGGGSGSERLVIAARSMKRYNFLL